MGVNPVHTSLFGRPFGRWFFKVGSVHKRVVVKRIIQNFLDEIIEELGRGNRLEFRDFGVFESKVRAARTAQNPKTLERVSVPSKRAVKFKVGRLMKIKLNESASNKALPLGGALGSNTPPRDVE